MPRVSAQIHCSSPRFNRTRLGNAEADRKLVDSNVRYIYDAEGLRVAKMNAGVLTSNYILGLGGEQLSELYCDGEWLHSNIYAGGQLVGTYDASGTRFHISDWLGTRRVQARVDGSAGLTCVSYPFGDGQDCGGADEDSTEHHFTGKERDSESGNDYFEARYYSSAMGRFLSPDWAVKIEPVPYATLDNPQSLNLYSYVLNNPLSRTDPDGHDFIILNDSKGAMGEGHNASLVGNDKEGWTYFSANGYGNGVSMDKFKTFSDFQKSDQSKRYDNGYRVETSTKQDAAMKDTGGKEIKTPYSVTAEKNSDGTNKSQNCADLTAAVGKSGGVDIGTPQKTDTVTVKTPLGDVTVASKTFTSPNQQYSGVVQNIKGTIVKPHCTGNNCN